MDAEQRTEPSNDISVDVGSVTQPQMFISDSGVCTSFRTTSYTPNPVNDPDNTIDLVAPQHAVISVSVSAGDVLASGSACKRFMLCTALLLSFQ